METLLGVALGALPSWLITHIYYRKSLRLQISESDEQIRQLLRVLGERNETDRQVLLQERMEESIAEYRKAGTPVRVIDTYGDLSDEEKADLLDSVLLRVRGRPAKSNPYRTKGS